MQAQFGFIEAFLHTPEKDETTIAVIGPLMIRAYEAFDVAFGRLTDDGTPMAADIIKSLYLTVILTDNDQRVVIHIVEKVVTRFGYLAAMSGKEPTAAPDKFHFGPPEQLVMV
jgi:hypothetical protein